MKLMALAVASSPNEPLVYRMAAVGTLATMVGSVPNVGTALAELERSEEEPQLKRALRAALRNAPSNNKL